MRITDPWIHAAGLQAVMTMLTQTGHKALLVGGCVRNALLGEAVADIDIATDAQPDQVIQLAAASGLKSIATGFAHGTVTVVAQGVPHEITTFRRDVETDGRRATVAYSSRIEEDAARRDFTMNALYADPQGEVIDPLGGLPDLEARRVRFVGHPDDRIREDYLRILRFFRFHACYGDPQEGIDPDGLAACAANSSGIDTLSRERIGAEMRKLLGAADPAPSLSAMQAAGVLHRILPGADSAWIAPLVHLEAGVAPDWLRRLAVLGGTDQAGRLRLSRAEARRLEQLTMGIGSEAGAAELAYRSGAGLAHDILLSRAALSGCDIDPAWSEQIALGASAECPVTPSDLMPGYAGAELGARLRLLEDRWIASGFQLSREQLIS